MSANVDFYMVIGDDLPYVRAQLLDANDDPYALYLSGTSVYFNVSGHGTSVISMGSATILDTGIGTSLSGYVEYRWQDGDTDDIDEGDYHMRWVIEWDGGAQESVPNDAPNTIRFSRRY